MLLLTEFDKALEIEKTYPASMIRKVYLTEGVVPTLNFAPSMFGQPLHFIYLGYNLRAVETFVSSLEGDTSRIFLISPISRWALYSLKLKFVEDLVISNQFDSREAKVQLVSDLTSLGKKKSARALELFKYNFAAIESNLDLLKWCAATGDNLDTAIASVEKYSYTDILFYLCGSKKHSYQQFIRTLNKYRYGKKHIISYLKDTLDAFIDMQLDNVSPPKKHEYIVNQLRFIIYLEDAMKLRIALDNVSELTDLLRGEV